jgi:hypothetical protein
MTDRNADEIRDLLARAESSTPEEQEKLGLAYAAVGPLRDDAFISKMYDLRRASGDDGDILIEDARMACYGFRGFGARAAVYDAVKALFLQEQISHGEFATLYGPWASVMDIKPSQLQSETRI